MASSDVRSGTSEGGDSSTPSSGSSTSYSTGYTPDDEFAGVDSAVAEQAAIQQAEDLALFYSDTPSPTQTESTVQGVANDDSVQNSGATQNGVANSQSPDAGRETQDNTLNTRTRPGEGA